MCQGLQSRAKSFTFELNIWTNCFISLQYLIYLRQKSELSRESDVIFYGESKSGVQNEFEWRLMAQNDVFYRRATSGYAEIANLDIIQTKRITKRAISAGLKYLHTQGREPGACISLHTHIYSLRLTDWLIDRQSLSKSRVALFDE